MICEITFLDWGGADNIGVVVGFLCAGLNTMAKRPGVISLRSPADFGGSRILGGAADLSPSGGDPSGPGSGAMLLPQWRQAVAEARLPGVGAAEPG